MEITELSLREIASDSWIISLVVLAMLILAIAAYNYQESFRSFLQLPLSNRYFIISGKSQHTTSPFPTLLFLVGLIGAALYGSFLSVELNAGSSPGLSLFLQMTAAIFGFFSIKFLLTRLIGVVFKLEDLVGTYVFEKLSFLNLIGLGLLGFCVIYRYGPLQSEWILYLAGLLAIGAYIMGLIYSYKNNENLIFRNFFYFILYLCALEISPFILLYKVLI
ncbi:DUF4271 domain-containing protein [Gilvibacter sp.]|uniref:DUF4271 domain-containing protein n=1 Tax=Gilvibacter sp. TaxID=2729997 RepID=UPI003B52B708